MNTISFERVLYVIFVLPFVVIFKFLWEVVKLVLELVWSIFVRVFVAGFQIGGFLIFMAVVILLVMKIFGM